MQSLSKQHCEVCRSGAPQISGEKAQALLVDIPAWRRDTHEGVDKLIREYRFSNYQDAIDFTVKISNLAEQEQHHPGILTEWGKVTVYWWTHKINGLHLNDFIMAAKSDRVAEVSNQL
jgi:4a-hydroxytetrahydrobiopterin dehydratase